MRFVQIAAAVGLSGCCSVLLAQHASEGDILDGERAFAASCASCHGPDGNLIEGIDLGRGLFRRDYSDAELAGIIINGIPDTPMPPTPAMSEEQARQIVQYLRDRSGSPDLELLQGNAAAGERLVLERSDCLDCHAINGAGARHGPDLSQIGRQLGAAELEASLLRPASGVRPVNRSYRVVLANGNEVQGRLLNHDTFTVQLVDADEKLRSFAKADLLEHGFVRTTMPSYASSMSPQEIADVLSYLSSLQGNRQ